MEGTLESSSSDRDPSFAGSDGRSAATVFVVPVAALIATDAQQRIARFNRGAELLFATTAAEVCGQPLGTLFPQLAHRPGLAQVPLEQRLLIGRRPDGTAVVVGAEIARVVVADGCVVMLQIPQTHPEHLPAGALLAEPDAQRTLLHALQEAVIVTDPAFHILDWNPAAEALYGWSVSEVLGKVVSELLPATYEDTDSAQVQQQLRRQGVWRGELIHHHRDGHPIAIQATVALVHGPDGAPLGLITINRDISARKQAESELHAHTARLELLTEVSRTFAEAGLDYAALLNLIAQRVVETLCDLCLIRFPSADEQLLVPAAMYYHDPSDQQTLQAIETMVMTPPFRPGVSDINFQVFHTGQPVLLASIDHSRFLTLLQPAAHTAFQQIGSHSLLVVPLRVRGHPIGVLGLYRSRPHWPAFTEDDVRLAQNLADRAALAIENARLFTQVQRELAERARVEVQLRAHATRLEILSEASRVFAAMGLHYEPLLERIVGHVARMLSCACALHRLSEDGRRLELVAGHNPDPEAGRFMRTLFRHNPLDAAESPHPIAQVFRSGRPQLIPVVDPDQISAMLVLEHQAALERFPIRSLVMVPLRAQGQPLGVLVLIRRQRAEPVFTGDDLHLAQDLADRAALAMANTRLLEQAQHELAERERAEQALAAERTELARRVAERTEDLSLANAELARAMRLKDEFLATMSHELRTPLNSILGRAQALQEAIYGPVMPEQVRALRAVEESGQHLLELINDILDLSKIETGKLELERAEVDVDMLCAMCLRMVKEAAVVKRLRLSSTLDGHVETIVADERRLRQILVNLLSNAVKFTPEGGEVGLELRGDAERGVVMFTVWDTGIGISPDDLPKLFRPFVQLDSSLNRQYTGTGLGLALVLRLAKAHGGSVVVESTPGRGSRFGVSLPWSPAGPAAEPGPPPIRAGGLPPLRRALVIEDSASTAALLTRHLGELDVQAEVHPRAAGALERACELRPDLILLDLLLPDSDGWEVLRRLKATPCTRSIPVLVASVVDEPARVREAGAVALLLKPLDRTALRQALRLHFALSAAVPEPIVQTDSAASPGLRILLAEDNEANIAAVSDYLTVKGYEVLVACNGREAIVRAQHERPDVILMDIQMPGMDGLEATRQIRADATLAHIPIIALTALAMPGDRERCLEAGANEYLTKPVHLRTLLTTIAAHSSVSRGYKAFPSE